MRCTVCGWLPFLAVVGGVDPWRCLAAILEALGPKPRTTLGGEEDVICLECQVRVAILMGLVKA